MSDGHLHHSTSGGGATAVHSGSYGVSSNSYSGEVCRMRRTLCVCVGVCTKKFLSWPSNGCDMESERALSSVGSFTCANIDFNDILIFNCLNSASWLSYRRCRTLRSR